MSERLLYHVEIANRDRREGDEELRGLLDALSNRLSGVEKDVATTIKEKVQALEYRYAGMNRMFGDRFETLEREMTEEMDNRIRDLSIKFEERLETLEEGLRDVHDDFRAVEHHTTRVEEDLTLKVRDSSMLFLASLTSLPDCGSRGSKGVSLWEARRGFSTPSY